MATSKANPRGPDRPTPGVSLTTIKTKIIKLFKVHFDYLVNHALPRVYLLPTTNHIALDHKCCLYIVHQTLFEHHIFILFLIFFLFSNELENIPDLPCNQIN